MKKFVIFILTCLLLTGCGKARTLTCVKEESNEDSKMNTTIIANYKGNTLDNFEMNYIEEFSDIEAANNYNNYTRTLEKLYARMNMSFEMTQEENKIIIKTKGEKKKVLEALQINPEDANLEMDLNVGVEEFLKEMASDDYVCK